MGTPEPRLERYSLLDISTHEADLEEIFLTYYQEVQAQCSPPY